MTIGDLKKYLSNKNLNDSDKIEFVVNGDSGYELSTVKRVENMVTAEINVEFHIYD